LTIDHNIGESPILSIAPKRVYRSPLRQQQVSATRERILRACADLVARRTSLDVSIPQLARAAGVSEPTVYRHFPTKRDLFGALATLQFERATAGLDPRTPDELAEALPIIFRRALELEGLLRWTLATPLGNTGRPTRGRRLDMLHRASSAEVDDPETAEHLPRLLLLLSSPIAALYWKDYLGLSMDEAAQTAAWGIRALAAHPGAQLQQTGSDWAPTDPTLR
jgi:AcrR family transcriptional regulator